MVTDTLKSPHEQIGRVLRVVRERNGRNLSDIADKAAISTSMLSQIERGVVSPSIDTLFRVCAALQFDIAELFDRVSSPPPLRIHHPGERLSVGSDGARLEQLAISVDTTHPAQMFLLELLPNCRMGLAGRGHEGVEMGYVLEGAAILSVGQEHHRLDSGDSVTFLSRLAHSLVNEGPATFRALWTALAPHRDFLAAPQPPG